MNAMEDQGEYRVILVDDHKMFLDGLQMILSEDPSLNIVKCFIDADEAIASLAEDVPDLIITDFNMPITDGLMLTRRVKEKYPDVKILVLTMHRDEETVCNIFDAEADGYILKNSDKKDLIFAIKSILNGSTFYSSDILPIILKRQKQQVNKNEEDIKSILSDREIDVIRLVAEEMTNDEIADKLFISKRTVETHRKNMIAKTHVNSTIGLLKYAVRNGLVQLS